MSYIFPNELEISGQFKQNPDEAQELQAPSQAKVSNTTVVYKPT